MKQQFEVKCAENPASKSLLIQFIIVFEECQQQNANMILRTGNVLMNILMLRTLVICNIHHIELLSMLWISMCLN